MVATSSVSRVNGGVDPAAAEADRLATVFSGHAATHYERVFQFLAQQLRDRHEAEDLTQRTFIRAFKAFARFDEERSFTPWIFTIARRELVDFYRRRRPDPVELDESLAGSTEELSEDLERADDAGRIWELARQLKPNQHQILLLHYAQDLPLPEAAAAMGITHVHAKVLLFRARQKLRSLWAQGEQELPI